MGYQVSRASASVIAAMAGAASAQPCTPFFEPMGAGNNGLANAMVAYSDGGGHALFVAGGFTQSGTVTANWVARWNGSAWSSLGTGSANGVGGTVISLAVFNDGNGEALYAGGVFTTAGGNPAARVARWNGTSWSAVGQGLSSNVQALCVYDDGTGAALYAGGVFTMSGTTPVLRVAKWTGTDWVQLGGGVDGTVQKLLAYDDGTGSQLYACGFFTSADNVPGTGYMARWNGTVWSPVGVGVDDITRAMCAFDDGSGMALYASIDWHATPLAVPVTRIARWDGESWSDVGPAPEVGVSNGTVVEFAVFNDGTTGRSSLYAAGTFTKLQGVFANRIAKWDGAEWGFLGSGITGGGQTVNTVLGAEVGSGPTLYVGGGFTSAGSQPANRMAQWRACPPGAACYANCDGTTAAPVMNVADFTCFLNAYADAVTLDWFAQVIHYANCDQSTGEPAVNVADFTCFLQKFVSCP